MRNYVHHVPGRLRVQLPEFKARSAETVKLEGIVARKAGVTHVECRPATGSIIVHYHPGLTDTAGLLRLLCPESRVSESATVQPQVNPAPALYSGLARKLLNAALWFALEKAVERALPALVSAIV